MLQELHCRVWRHNPDDGPSDTALWYQLLLGLQEGPLARALKGNVWHNPDYDFAAIHQEALLFETKYKELLKS